MKTCLRFVTLGLILFLPLAAAHAQLSVSAISDKAVNAGSTLTVNVVASDPDDAAITVTASLPAFATLNEPKTGNGIVSTTIALAPQDADVGSYPASVTATAGEQSATEGFQITVTAAGTNQPPRVTAPATASVVEGAHLQFVVTASDADADPITALTAVTLPTGASFSADAGNASGTFAWTPDLAQAGAYDVTFVASNAQADSATTHITVTQSNLGPVTLAPIDDVTMAEGDIVNVMVVAIDPDENEIELSAILPSFATLNAPTSGTGDDSLATTITLAPGSGTAGSYSASVTATSDGDTATEPFTINVTPPALEASASLIGAFNVHKKFICFNVKPVDESFDVLDVSLSSITLSYGGESIHTVRPTHLATDCDEDCEECGDHDGATDSLDCEPSHIMACFSMSDLRALFHGASLPDSLAAAAIEGDLKVGGGTFIAVIGGKHVEDGAKGEKGDGNGDQQQGNVAYHNNKLSLRVHPNPMNPNADISFTTTQPGRVLVAIYDLSGKLVKRIAEGALPAGAHAVPWDGSAESGGRVASGVYFVKVETATLREVQRVTVLK